LIDPVETQQMHINALVELITRYRGDPNDLLLVGALRELRSVAENQR